MKNNTERHLCISVGFHVTFSNIGNKLASLRFSTSEKICLDLLALTTAPVVYSVQTSIKL